LGGARGGKIVVEMSVDCAGNVTGEVIFSPPLRSGQVEGTVDDDPERIPGMRGKLGGGAEGSIDHGGV
jgi:hypothetical protein